MCNADLVRKFFEGGTTGHGSNLYINGDCLIEYNTCLAQRTGTGYILNTTKYSRTTSKIQTWIKYHARNIVAEINNLDFGVRDLSRYITESAENFA